MKLTLEGEQGKATMQQAIQQMSARRMAAACATALTRTGQQIKTGFVDEIKAKIDRPTPYTLRSVYLRGATAQRLEAEVWLKDDASGGLPATKYLGPLVDGGPRSTKRFELALQSRGTMPKGWRVVPAAGARLDQYGNLSRGQIAQIIAQLGTELLRGYDNTPKGLRARIAGQRRAGGQFTAVLPGMRTRLKPGIYQREFTGRNLTPVVLYVQAVSYSKRLDFEGVARRVADEQLPIELDRAIGEQLQRMASAGTQQSFPGV